MEPPFAGLLPLVQALAEALIPCLGKPFAFFGHSMGALISFELARQLRRQHAPGPVHLFVSGHSAPHILREEPPIHDLPEPEFVQQLSRLNGMSPKILQNAELMQLLVPSLRADFATCETYEYQADSPLDCPISVYGGLQDTGVTRESLEAWREHTMGCFSLRMFPGDHFYLNSDRSLLLRTLARELSSYVAATPAVLAEPAASERRAVAAASQ